MHATVTLNDAFLDSKAIVIVQSYFRAMTDYTKPQTPLHMDINNVCYFQTNFISTGTIVLW